MAYAVQRLFAPAALLVAVAGLALAATVSAPRAVPHRQEMSPECDKCTGDCDGNGSVTIDELVAGVRLALGTDSDACEGFGCCTPGNGIEPDVSVDCLVRAVGHALDGCPPACFTGPEPTTDPPSITSLWTPEAKREALATIRLASAWGCAELVDGNTLTTGWEDSVNISRDERRLSFVYLPFDLVSFDGQGGGDLNRLDEFRRGPDRGNRPTWVPDFYTSTFGPGGRTCRPQPFPFSIDNRLEWGGMQADDGDWYYVASGFDPDIQSDLYRNEDRIPFSSPSFEEDDPHYDSATRVLYFDSKDRPGAPDSADPEFKDIWTSVQVAPGRWSEPAPMPAPVNLAGSDDRQAHFGPDGKLYFSSSRGNGALSIHVTEQIAPGVWTEPAEIVSAPPKLQVTPLGLALVAVGEPTLTADGTLYFAALFYHPPSDVFDLDIARAGPRLCRRYRAFAKGPSAESGSEPITAADAVEACRTIDADGDGSADIAELIAAVEAALYGCPVVSPSPIPAETPTPPAPRTTVSASPVPPIRPGCGDFHLQITVESDDLSAGARVAGPAGEVDIVRTRSGPGRSVCDTGAGGHVFNDDGRDAFGIEGNEAHAAVEAGFDGYVSGIEKGELLELEVGREGPGSAGTWITVAEGGNDAQARIIERFPVRTERQIVTIDVCALDPLHPPPVIPPTSTARRSPCPATSRTRTLVCGWLPR